MSEAAQASRVSSCGGASSATSGASSPSAMNTGWSSPIVLTLLMLASWIQSCSPVSTSKAASAIGLSGSCTYASTVSSTLYRAAEPMGLTSSAIQVGSIVSDSCAAASSHGSTGSEDSTSPVPLLASGLGVAFGSGPNALTRGRHPVNPIAAADSSAIRGVSRRERVAGWFAVRDVVMGSLLRMRRQHRRTVEQMTRLWAHPQSAGCTCIRHESTLYRAVKSP